MNIIGLFNKMFDVATQKKAPLKWGIVAKEKGELLKPGKAPKAKKAHRKMVQASRRENR